MFLKRSDTSGTVLIVSAVLYRLPLQAAFSKRAEDKCYNHKESDLVRKNLASAHIPQHKRPVSPSCTDLSGKRLVFSLSAHKSEQAHSTETRLILKFLNEQILISLRLLLYPEINEQSKEVEKALLLNPAHSAYRDSEASTLNKQEECHTSVSSCVASRRTFTRTDWHDVQLDQ